MLRAPLLRRVLFCLLPCLSTMIAAAAEPPKAAPVVPPREGKRETIQLFNGKDLTGWIGHKKYWSVQDGVIVGKSTAPIPVSTYLLTDRSFSDFRLVCDFKLAQSETHSGIAMWGRLAPEEKDPYTYAGLLVMFPSNYGFYDLYGRKGIHGNAPIAKPVGKQHDWNHIEILAQGNRVRFVLNGTLISDWREPEPDRIKEAPIGLQLHSNKDPEEVQFKNLTIETFPEDRLTTVKPSATTQGNSSKMRVYIGTYTRGTSGSKGIYLADFDLATGRLSEPTLAGEAENPSFLAIHPTGKYLYAVAEVDDRGKKSGAVAAFTIDPSTGKLTVRGKEACGGGGFPCHISVDREGRHALTANYGSGSAAVVAIQPDGSLGKQTALVQHHGAGTDPRRQEGPHAHSINLDAANRFAFVADLGLDEVKVYRYDPQQGTLVANDPPAARLASASGPRHFAFHPDGHHAYVINELSSTVTAFSYDPYQGRLTEIQTISTVPSKFQGTNYPAEVQVHPSGKFVYGSNRGHDSIAVFQVDASGRLIPAGHQGANIKNPRNFGIDPTGQFMIVANQDSDTLVVFRIDQQGGGLQPTGSIVKVPKPVCVKFLAVGK